MPKQIQKSLHEFLSKMKISNKQIKFQIRSLRRRTQTPPFAATHPIDAVTLSDIDQFLFENFRSLYLAGDDDGGEEDISILGGDKGAKTTSCAFDSPVLLDTPPPPENLCRSERFFVASGSSSSRILKGDQEAASSSSDAAAAAAASAPDDFIALLTHSPSPYEDFRRSMQEMVDARVGHDGKVDWEYMQELLFCYLDLNNKKSYRYILRAFVDLIVVLRENSGKPTAIRPLLGGGGGGEADKLKRVLM